MNWLFFALITPFLEAGKDLISKRSLRHVDEYIVVWCASSIAGLVLVPISIMQGVPLLGELFWWLVVVNGVLVAVANVLYMRALKVSDVSLSVPFITFTPVFLLVLSPLILGESVGLFGALGVFFIVAGAYLFKIREVRNGVLEPFIALLRSPGPRYVLLVALIWSFTSVFDKIGIQSSSPVFWAGSMSMATSLVLSPIIFLRRNASSIRWHWFLSYWRILLPIGILTGARMFSQMMAVQSGILAYVISLKRMSVLLVVLGGIVLFKEGGFRERIPGAVLMILGVLFITLFGDM